MYEPLGLGLGDGKNDGGVFVLGITSRTNEVLVLKCTGCCESVNVIVITARPGMLLWLGKTLSDLQSIHRRR
jgi:hypothetical protein